MRLVNTRARRLACTFVFGYWLVGCASAPQTRLLLANPPDVPPAVELTGVPFFPQQEYHCGPASLAAIYNYRGADVVPDQIARLVYVPEFKGSLQVEMVAATRQFGLLAVPLDGRLESLLRELAAGNPILVLQNLGVDAYPVWHYEILIGYDLAERRMILRSGTDRRVTRGFRTFETTWRRAGHWALAVVDPDSIPVTATAQSYVAAVIDMEQVGRMDSARRGYASALRRWPDNPLALGGLGNAAYAMGDYAAAEAAYREALELSPEQAGLWNNLAYALAQQGRRDASLAAVRRALELEPDNAGYRDSLIELQNRDWK